MVKAGRASPKGAHARPLAEVARSGGVARLARRFDRIQGQAEAVGGGDGLDVLVALQVAADLDQGESAAVLHGQHQALQRSGEKSEARPAECLEVTVFTVPDQQGPLRPIEQQRTARGGTDLGP